MSNFQHTTAQTIKKSPVIFLDYKPASYRPGKDNHVSYYVLNPLTSQLVRKKIWLMKI